MRDDGPSATCDLVLQYGIERALGGDRGPVGRPNPGSATAVDGLDRRRRYALGLVGAGLRTRRLTEAGLRRWLAGGGFHHQDLETFVAWLEQHRPATPLSEWSQPVTDRVVWSQRPPSRRGTPSVAFVLAAVVAVFVLAAVLAWRRPW